VQWEGNRADVKLGSAGDIELIQYNDKKRYEEYMELIYRTGNKLIWRTGYGSGISGNRTAYYGEM
jgi:hypothetical protein